MKLQRLLIKDSEHRILKSLPRSFYSKILKTQKKFEFFYPFGIFTD
jgi:hypothetical protein